MSAIIGYTTWGSVRGMGPVRSTVDEAYQDVGADRAGCRSQHGYSDRAVYAIDRDGYVVHVDDHERNVWPYGRTSPALKLGRGDAREIPEWLSSEVQS